MIPQVIEIWKKYSIQIIGSEEKSIKCDEKNRIFQIQFDEMGDGDDLVKDNLCVEAGRERGLYLTGRHLEVTAFVPSQKSSVEAQGDRGNAENTP